MTNLILKYVAGVKQLHRPVFNRAWRVFVTTLCKVDESLFCYIFNSFRKSEDINFSYDKKSALFIASDRNGRFQYFKDPVRGSHLYWNGLKHRADRLAKSYFLENIQFQKDSVIVDCGANYGDLRLYLDSYISPECYVAVEPGEVEFRCLEFNAPNARLCNYGLGEKNELKEFFVNSNDADSSFIKPTLSYDSLFIRCKTLDDLVEELGLSRIKLLKIEAEGYEPEVLLGASSALDITDYVAVDAGPERGVNADITVVDVFNTLYAKGFQLLAFNNKNCRALFINNPEIG